MLLNEMVQPIRDFGTWTHPQKIRFFGWYLHTQKNLNRFNQANIRACYDELHLPKPSNVSPYFSQLKEKKPSELLKDRTGYYLAKQVRDELNARYGKRVVTIQVEKMLEALPGKISNEAERVFLTEALICFKHKAFRAAIVMTWNLAYDHLEDWILNNHLAAFNTQLPVRYPKSRVAAIGVKDHFSDLKESEVIEVCRSANLITGNVHKILTEKLSRRNIAAHPSTVEITQLTAEDFIMDLVSNVVLKLA